MPTDTTKTTTRKPAARRATRATKTATSAKRATSATSTSNAKKATSATSAPTTTRAKADPSLAARAGRTIAQKPYVSAAIATGAVTAVAAVAAGAYFLSRRDQSLNETAEELGTRIKDGFSEAKASASDFARKTRARFDAAGTKTQSDYAAEALTLKQTGESEESPLDPLVADQLKTGAIAY